MDIMKDKITEPATFKSINKGIVEPFDYQGKKKSQIEFSYKAFMIPSLIIAAWIMFYGFFKLVKYLL